MPIDIVSTPEKILGAFGLGPSKATELASYDIVVGLTPTAIVFKHEGKPIVSVPVKSGAVSMAMNGTLGPASQQAIAYKLAKAINQALKAVPPPIEVAVVETLKESVMDLPADDVTPEEVKDFQEQFKEKPVGDEPLTEAIGDVLEGVMAQEKAEPSDDIEAELQMESEGMAKEEIQPDPSAEGPVSEGHAVKASVMMKKAPVMLKEADQLYQPVRSTDKTSRYHVIGITEHGTLKIAARLKGGSLSVRIEGDLQKYKKQLEESGIGLTNFEAGYVSLHLSVGSMTMARKTVGSLLMGIGIPMRTDPPQIELIAGKGA